MKDFKVRKEIPCTGTQTPSVFVVGSVSLVWRLGWADWDMYWGLFPASFGRFRQEPGTGDYLFFLRGLWLASISGVLAV